jgi:hypothetical protein
MNRSMEVTKWSLKRGIVLLAVVAWAAIFSISAAAQTAPSGQHPSHTQTSPAPAATAVPADQAAARAAAEKAAAKLRTPAAADAGDFYIVSSIAMAQKQIVLKLPTEVTLLVQTGAQSQFLDEQGKPLTLKDLRAGDTVFVVLQKPTAGTPVVKTLQRGGMTVNELHKKYMSGS